MKSKKPKISKPKCTSCKHLKERHFGGEGTCMAERSCGPAGTFKCSCNVFCGYPDVGPMIGAEVSR